MSVLWCLLLCALARAYDLVPATQDPIYPGIFEVDYYIWADFQYWCRYDTYYDNQPDVWDVMLGVDLYAYLKGQFTFTFFDVYQYTPEVEFALFDVTPKVQWGFVPLDMVLIDGLAFDYNILVWVDVAFCALTIVHQHNMNMPMTSFIDWFVQLVEGGSEYYPFSVDDLQYYGNPSYYIDPFLSTDLAQFVNSLFGYEVLPPFTIYGIVLYQEWRFGTQSTVLTPSYP